MIEKIIQLVPDASAHGHNIDTLIYWMHYLMFALFIGWGIFFIYALIRFRKGAHPKADPVGVKSHLSSYLEIGVAAFEVVLLVWLSIPVWADYVVKLPDEKDAVQVRVVGEQFKWIFHYPGTDGKFGSTAANFVNVASNPLGIDPADVAGKDDFIVYNEMHLPKDKPVIVRITSHDVIHSFGVPGLRIKQDAIPGMEVKIPFTPIKTGPNWVYCSQLCGTGHSQMAGKVIVDDDAQYNTWFQQQVAAAQSGGGDDFD